MTVSAISQWREYSLRVLAEKVISLVLPLSFHTDASARVTRASTRGENDLLARASELTKKWTFNWNVVETGYYFITCFVPLTTCNVDDVISR